MVVRGDRSVRGDEVMLGSREGVARLFCCEQCMSVDRF